MNKTSIPWVDGFTWNPITGCTGPTGTPCAYCYAKAIVRRFTPQPFFARTEGAEEARQAHYDVKGSFPWGFHPTMHPARLEEPVNRKKPATIFLGSMGDLFDPAYPDSFRDRVFTTVAATPRHRYVVLTKRAKAMADYFAEKWGTGYCWREGLSHVAIPNLMLGVTVTSQADWDERDTSLVRLAAIGYRLMISIEPMLGPLDLGFSGTAPLRCRAHLNLISEGDSPCEPCGCWPDRPLLDFVAIGAKTPGKALHEQGCPVPHDGIPGTCEPTRADDCNVCPDSWDNNRPAEWLRDLLAQCRAAGVSVNYKHGNSTPAVDGITYDATIAEVMSR